MSARSEARWKTKGQSENNQRYALMGMMEGLVLTRKTRDIIVPPLRNHSKAYVRQWMVVNADDYDNGTQIAEAANIALNLPDAWMDDETHWIWEMALEAMEMKND